MRSHLCEGDFYVAAVVVFHLAGPDDFAFNFGFG